MSALLKEEVGCELLLRESEPPKRSLLFFAISWYCMNQTGWGRGKTHDMKTTYFRGVLGPWPVDVPTKPLEPNEFLSHATPLPPRILSFIEAQGHRPDVALQPGKSAWVKSCITKSKQKRTSRKRDNTSKAPFSCKGHCFHAKSHLGEAKFDHQAKTRHPDLSQGGGK